MAELRDIFRALNGDEFHAWVSYFMHGSLCVQLPFSPVPFPISGLKSKIEGPYRVWQEK